MAWYMWLQFGACMLGAIGFAYNKKYAEAWIWMCYSFANLGFVSLAGGFK